MFCCTPSGLEPQRSWSWLGPLQRNLGPELAQRNTQQNLGSVLDICVRGNPEASEFILHGVKSRLTVKAVRYPNLRQYLCCMLTPLTACAEHIRSIRSIFPQISWKPVLKSPLTPCLIPTSSCHIFFLSAPLTADPNSNKHLLNCAPVVGQGLEDGEE
jgi:hypothetical protein